MAVNEQNITPGQEAVKFALSHYPQFLWLALTVFVQTLVVPEPKQKYQLTLLAYCHSYVAYIFPFCFSQGKEFVFETMTCVLFSLTHFQQQSQELFSRGIELLRPCTKTDQDLELVETHCPLQ